MLCKDQSVRHVLTKDALYKIIDQDERVDKVQSLNSLPYVTLDKHNFSQNVIFSFENSVDPDVLASEEAS